MYAHLKHLYPLKDPVNPLSSFNIGFLLEKKKISPFKWHLRETDLLSRFFSLFLVFHFYFILAVKKPAKRT